MVSETISHYRILRKIGAGGMGEVYLAEDTKLGRQVALKLLRADITGENAKKRLLREARAAAQLDHPNICAVHEVGEENEQSFIVMQYVEGETLACRLERQPLAQQELFEIALQIVDGLLEAHAHNIIHRDIKPANIIITSRGLVKIMDFGLATFAAEGDFLGTEAETQTLLTQPGMIIGTVAYMSPEQTRGEALDGRSDIFSLGVVLYEAATARRPFFGESRLSLMHEIATADPLVPSSIRPDLPVEFDAIVARALAKDRDLRYSSITELAEALRSLKSEVSEAITSSWVKAKTEAELTSESLVGRDPELKQLQDYLSQALEGSGRMVFLTGEPGIGKTSLADEFLRRALRQQPTQLTVCRGRCVEQYGPSEAYLPFLDALGDLLSRPGRERITGVLRVFAPTWALQFPGSFSGAEREQLQRETIGATRERMLREMGDALAALAAKSPLIVLLEDLHWADSSSADLLRHLCQRLSGQRLLILATLRPEDLDRSNHPLKNYKREMQAHQLCFEIAPGQLSIENIARYLDTQFAPNDFPKELASLIERKTEGHPLFTTSLVRFLAENGDIIKVNEHWTLGRKLSQMVLDVPKSIREMIRKKVDVLDKEDQRALQYASIEGEEFLSTLVAKLLGEDELVLEERLDRLERIYRLIQTCGEEELPDGSLGMRYRFSHALFQNVLYAELVSNRRALLHRQAGEHLVGLFGDQTQGIAVQLAMHFERGRRFAQAIYHLTQSGDNAAALYANAEAEQLYGRALSLVRKLPAQEQPQWILKLHQKRGSINLALSRFEESVGDFEQMGEAARLLGSPAHECSALSSIASVLFHQHRLREMATYANKALKAAEAAASETLRIETMAQLAQRHIGRGELAESKAISAEVTRVARSLNHKPALITGLTYRGIVHFFQTEYARAQEALAEAKALAFELRDGFMLPYISFFLGLVLGNLGRMSEAFSLINETLEMVRRNGNHLIHARLINSLGWLHRELGDLNRATELDREGVEVARRYLIVEAEANALINLIHDHTARQETTKAFNLFPEAESLLERDQWNRWRFHQIRFQDAAAEHWLTIGDLDQASVHAQRLLENATQHEVAKYIAVSHKLLAEVAIASDDLVTAESELMAAVASLEGKPAPLVSWKIYSALGRLRLKLGNAETANQALLQGTTIITQIADNIADRQLRETFLNSEEVRDVLVRRGTSC